MIKPTQAPEQKKNKNGNDDEEHVLGKKILLSIYSIMMRCELGGGGGVVYQFKVCQGVNWGGSA